MLYPLCHLFAAFPLQDTFTEKLSEIIRCDANKNFAFNLNCDTNPIALLQAEIAGQRNGFFQMVLLKIFPEKLHKLRRTLQMTGRAYAYRSLLFSSFII